MTPKEKAEQLVESFMNIKQQKLADYSIIYHPTAKQCALISVDEILNAINPFGQFLGKDYWEEVKNEIEKL
jgi:hypothetical protein